MPAISKLSSVDGDYNAAAVLTGDVANVMDKSGTLAATCYLPTFPIDNHQSITGNEAALTTLTADILKEGALVSKVPSRATTALSFPMVLETDQTPLSATWSVTPRPSTWTAAQRTVINTSGGSANATVILTSSGLYSVNRRAVNAFALNGS